MNAIRILSKIFVGRSRKTSQPAPFPIIRGDGKLPWLAEVVGHDIVIRGARVTCFGGADDPQDSGETASGLSTRRHPTFRGCALPMNGRQFPHMTAAEHAALDGSPIPRMPWGTLVEFACGGITQEIPVIDIGPGLATGNAADLTVAAARVFDPRSTASSASFRCDIRIIDGAKFLRDFQPEKNQ